MENYELVSHIGKGSFGLVSKVKRKSDGQIFVWKELDYGRMSEKEKQQLVAEVNILRDLSHPNIVQYYDRIIDKKATKIYIIMEYCEGGDLKTLLRNCKKNKDYIAEDVIWKIFSQILLALNDCHTKKSGKVLHRDLKPANIFLDAQNNVKLGDFGLSRTMGDQSMFAYTYVGTPYYMSPEQITESKYNEKSDIWSTGCLLYEIAALRPPFEASNHLSLAMKIKAGKFDRIPIRYSENLQKVIELMLRIKSDSRPSADDLLTIPQVAIRVHEKRLKDKTMQVKSKEKELAKKEEELKEFEKTLDKKDKELREMETKANEKKILVESKEDMGENNNFAVQRPAPLSELNARDLNSWERKRRNMTEKAMEKENDYMYQGNRTISQKLETLQQNYKTLKTYSRGLSGDYSDAMRNVGSRRSQEGLSFFMK